ncbi:hypothetical protein PRZ48_012361 [Zasmidium cellare]|uniref:F-box domain-containing protein n=1 Tax=Zasmidium cellare TaxID=395010 RepID=A0ABR0E4N0_ZASCE|nr:hypothetical protein PRZ48_012361 [Zasmidium cellare]
MATVRPPQTLHNFPDELVQHIADYVGEKDTDSFRNLRFVCRRMHPVATRCFAKARFRTLSIGTSKSKVESAIKLFENCTALGLAVEVVWLQFSGSQTHEFLLDMVSRQANTAAAKDSLALKLREFQARRQAEHLQVDLPRLLTQFPNMKSLSLMYMNKFNQQPKLALPALQEAIQKSGCNLTTLLMYQCKTSSSNLGTLLSIFPNLEKLDIKQTDITDDWVDALREVRAHGGALQNLFLETDGRCENARDFNDGVFNIGMRMSLHGVSYDIRVSDKRVEANGAAAVKFALDRILEGWERRRKVLQN